MKIGLMCFSQKLGVFLRFMSLSCEFAAAAADACSCSVCLSASIIELKFNQNNFDYKHI